MSAHESAHSGESSDDVSEDLLARAIEALESQEGFDLEAFLSDWPTHSAVLRERIEKLSRAGLLRGDAFASARTADGQAEKAGSLDGCVIAGRYRVLRQIGQGGMGLVLLARDDQLDRDVALKLGRLSAPGDNLRRFEREARILGRLDHPNIVPVHDLGRTDDGRPCFVMRVVSGRTLHDVIDALEREDLDLSREFSVARRVQIVIAVCEAVSFAHARGVLHRDLKPSNVMIGGFGEVQLLDWGLARVVGVADEPRSAGSSNVVEARLGMYATVDGYAFGTPSYCSPEQARGETAAVDFTSDVFGLGATLCHFLSGRPLYYGRDREEVLIRAREGRITDPEFTRSPWPVPDPLIAVCRKATAASKGARYATVDALRQDLQAFLDGRTLSVWRDDLRTALWRSASRHPARAVLILLTPLLLMLSIWIVTERAGRERDMESRLAHDVLALPELILERESKHTLGDTDVDYSGWAHDALGRLAEQAPDLATTPGAPGTAARLRAWQVSRPDSAAGLMRSLLSFAEILARAERARTRLSSTPRAEAQTDRLPESADLALALSNVGLLVETLEHDQLRRAIWNARRPGASEDDLTRAKALAMTPDGDADDIGLVVRALAEKEWREAASEVANAALKLGKRSFEILRLSGQLAFKEAQNTRSPTDALRAVIHLEAAMGANPRSCWTSERLGSAYKQLDTFLRPGTADWITTLKSYARRHAAENFETSIALDRSGRLLTPWINWGNLEGDPNATDRRPDWAESCFQAALAVQGNSVPAWRNYANFLLDQHRWSEELDACLAWSALDPMNVQALEQLGMGAESLADAHEQPEASDSTRSWREFAACAYLAALSIDPDRADTWHYLAAAQVRLGRHEEAVCSLSHSLAIREFALRSDSRAQSLRRQEAMLAEVAEKAPLFDRLRHPPSEANWAPQADSLFTWARVLLVRAHPEARPVKPESQPTKR